MHRWSWLNCIRHVVSRWCVNLRLKRLLIFGSLLIIWEWWSKTMLLNVVVFHLYLEMINFLATHSCDWYLIEWSILWCMYWWLTYTLKGDEITRVLIGNLAFVVAILLVAMLGLYCEVRLGWIRVLMGKYVLDWKLFGNAG